MKYYIINKNTLIDSHGFRVLSSSGRPINYDGCPLSKIKDDEIKKASAIIKFLEPLKNNVGNSNSYSLKHIAENYAQSLVNENVYGGYVSNGAMIVSMIQSNKFKFRNYYAVDCFTLKYTKKFNRKTSINVDFNITKKSLKNLKEMIKQNELNRN